MKISGSILGIENNEEILKIVTSGIDYLHLDVMDNIFVNNNSSDYTKNELLYNQLPIPLDVHLMVNDVYSYVDQYKNLNPEFITFHYEAVADIDKMINYIKNNNIKVGISLKPDTNIDEIEKYLSRLDLVLVMSVEPGFGGQKFLESSIAKVNKLYNLREKNQYKFVIEIDGGINDTNASTVKADIVVVGNYITSSSNYKEQVRKLRGDVV